MLFLNLARQILEYYLKLTQASSFNMISISVFTGHGSTIRCEVLVIENVAECNKNAHVELINQLPKRTVQASADSTNREKILWSRDEIDMKARTVSTAQLFWKFSVTL